MNKIEQKEVDEFAVDFLNKLAKFSEESKKLMATMEEITEENSTQTSSN